MSPIYVTQAFGLQPYATRNIGWFHTEDRLLDDLRDCRRLHGVEPIVMHTNMMERRADD